MPSISNPTLTLTTVNQNVTIDVAYTATYSAFERQLAGLGMRFQERIDVEGVDARFEGTTITSFPAVTHPVTVGAGPQAIPRSLSKTVTRSSLQEDPDAGDSDEIRAKVRINSIGLPPEFTPSVFSPEQVLLG